MPAHFTSTPQRPLPPRRWSRPYEITLSDTTADRNLYRDGVPYKYIQNVGTSGVVAIVWSDGSTVDIGIPQYGIVEGGLWQHAKTTGTTAGVELRGLVGINGESEL